MLNEITSLLNLINQWPLSLVQKNFWHSQFNKSLNEETKLVKLHLNLNNYIQASIAKQELHNLVKVSYPSNLPISLVINTIKQQIFNHSVIIISGETGCGKTTQLPKLLFELGLANYATIGHTQPRKVAAKSLAKRISEELNHPEVVGHKVRFQDKTRPTTCIKLMTDGILLQEIQSDKYLLKYSALIIDEAHERSLNIDFILGYLKTILPKRPDLKLIITSATIDNQKIAKFFNDAPVIQVKGKTYPVDIIYQPLNEGSENNQLNEAIYTAICACLEVELGNILVFLPGEGEIKQCINFLKKTKLSHYQLLPLFSRQNELEQNQVFNLNGQLKIIITTNVAETSLTIPGIKFVIDSGLARIKRYNSRLKVEQLLVEKISQASIKQRAGRAGRVSHGMCICLFSQEDYMLRPKFNDPEILRSNLANVILKLLNFKLGDPLHFPLIDKPQDKAFRDGFKTLFQLKAINLDNTITPMGRQMAQIPLDSNLAAMLIAAGSKFNCLYEVLIITAYLAINDPREYKIEWQQQAYVKQQVWADKQSDFIAILNLWHWYHHELAHKKSKRKLLLTCCEYFVSLSRLREWHELYRQLKECVYNLGYQENTGPASYQQLHQALLTGLLNNIGQKDKVENFYLGTHNKKFLLHPQSFIQKPNWVCAASLTQTSKLYARINAYIEPQWLVPLTKHLIKYSYGEALWDKKRGEVVVLQTALLAGLAIYQQKVSFSQLNLNLARQIFIKQALIQGELVGTYAFLEHNKQVIKKLEDLEDKFRLDLIVIEDALFDFYIQVLPNDICDITSFNHWQKQNEQVLKLDFQTFIQQFSQIGQNIKLYPDSLNIAGETIRLKYTFNPESNEDGVTAILNLEQLNQLHAKQFSWLVPGLIRDKLNYWLKALPKSIRLNLNPMSDLITNFLLNTSFTQDLIPTFIQYIKETKQVIIKPVDLLAISLPKYLIFHFRVMDNNHLIASGDDLHQLKQQLAPQLAQLVSKLNTAYEMQNIQGWVPMLEQLTKEVKLTHKNQQVIGYSSLIVSNGGVNLTVTEDLNKANLNTRKGLLQLIGYHLKPQLKMATKQLANFKTVSLYLNDVYSQEELAKDSSNFLLRMSVNLTNLPTNEEEFNYQISQSRQNFGPNLVLFSQVMQQLANCYQQVKLAITNHPLSETISLQLDDLIYPGFLNYLRFAILEHYPRYLTAILKRLAKYATNPKRDKELEEQINQLYQAWYDYVEAKESLPKAVAAEVYAFKYKIEELRVSLFAQELKTPYPVSSKRLWNELAGFEDSST